MNKNTMEWGLYEAPTIKTLDILSEGVLCASGALRISNWEEDEEILNF